MYGAICVVFGRHFCTRTYAASGRALQHKKLTHRLSSTCYFNLIQFNRIGTRRSILSLRTGRARAAFKIPKQAFFNFFHALEEGYHHKPCKYVGPASISRLSRARALISPNNNGALAPETNASSDKPLSYRHSSRLAARGSRSIRFASNSHYTPFSARQHNAHNARCWRHKSHPKLADHNRLHAADVLHAVYYLTSQPIDNFCQVPLDLIEHYDNLLSSTRKPELAKLEPMLCAAQTASDNNNNTQQQQQQHQQDRLLSAEQLVSKLHNHIVAVVVAAAAAAADSELPFGIMGANLTALEVMALYTAAAMHDFQHPGRTNSFLVATNSPLVSNALNASIYCSPNFRLAASHRRQPTTTTTTITNAT